MVTKLYYISILLLFALSSTAQETTIIRDYGGKRMVSDPSKYTLVGSSQHTVLIQHYELISEKDRDNLVDIIINSIDFYLDQVMEFSDGKMTVRKTNRQIAKDLNLIVENNIKLYDYQVDEAFVGFSERFMDKIMTIEKLSWDTKSISDGNSSFNSEEMAYNYVQSQIAALKDISTEDLLSYAEQHIHEHSGDEFMNDITRNPQPLDTSDWEVNSPLIPYDYQLAMLDSPDIGLYLEPNMEPEQIPDGTNKRIVELLESNNRLIAEFGKQMIAMQNEMIALRKEGNAYRKSYEDMSTDIKDLQVAMSEIRDASQSVATSPGLKPLESEESYIVQFQKNSDEITLVYQMELNEVYHLLMTEPSRKVMLTGFADISGSPELNADISRKRALAVKSYLLRKGISGSRMIVNYLGDAASISENPNDRKVEIAWLGN